jgi:hypothetical protein
MIIENQKDIEKPNAPEKQMVLLQLHQRLKNMEIDITRQLGTVIIK